VLRIRDVYSGSRFLPILHLGSRIQKRQQERGEKNVRPCFVAPNCTILNFQRIIELFIQKIVINLSKICLRFEIRDPRSGLPIPDPGVKKAPDPGSGSATLKFLQHKKVFLSLIKISHRIKKFSRPKDLFFESFYNLINFHEEARGKVNTGSSDILRSIKTLANLVSFSQSL
jgi:hypothetical protein